MLKSSIHKAFAALGLLIGLSIYTPVWAQTMLEAPQGEIVLVIKGNITNTNVGDEAHFDIDMIHAMPVNSITTTTEWYDGPAEFVGVNMNYLMELVGASGNDLDASATDGYKVLIPLQDTIDYPMVLAYEAYGEELLANRRGPLWIMYPFDDFPDTQTDEYTERAIWQVVELNIH